MANSRRFLIILISVIGMVLVAFSCIGIFTLSTVNVPQNIITDCTSSVSSGTLMLSGIVHDAEGNPLRHTEIRAYKEPGGCPQSPLVDADLIPAPNGEFREAGMLMMGDPDVTITISTETLTCAFRYNISQSQSTALEMDITITDHIEVAGRALHYHAPNFDNDPNYERDLPQCL